MDQIGTNNLLWKDSRGTCWELCMSDTNTLYNQLIASEDGKGLIQTVTKRLRVRYGGSIEDSELEGWAQLGIARAAKKFDSSRLNGVTQDMLRRLCSYLIAKGYRHAIDEMRHAKVVGRKRYGKLSGGPVAAMTMTDLQSHVASSYPYHSGDRPLVGDTIDETAADPCDDAAKRELIAQACAQLQGMEKTIFQKRYCEGMELRDIANQLDVTPTRVYQLHTRVIGRIREYVSGNNPVMCPNRGVAVAD